MNIEVPITKLVWDYTIFGEPNNDSLLPLVESILENGFLTDVGRILVIAAGDYYLVVNGRRRAKAAVIVGLDTIPVRVHVKMSDSEIRLMRVVESN